MVTGLGSSPHGRGTRRRHGQATPYPRIIPARAGNTPPPGLPRAAMTDHPRTGGEHSPHAGQLYCSAGSSPHGRGTLAQVAAFPPAGRIIPARAGNTAQGSAAMSKPPDHPRTGGEHLTAPKASDTACGSSPHGRGTLLIAGLLRGGQRIIPARAGNTCCSSPPLPIVPDHPRTGGEHDERECAQGITCGSSPHGRGTP